MTELTREEALWAHVPFEGTDTQLALSRMPEVDREEMDQVMRETRTSLNAVVRNGKWSNGFGPAMTYELLAALGRWMLREEDK